MTIIDLVPHMDAGDRNAWQGDQDERPLSDFGWEQARAQAEALADEKIDALYSSPALRARQTLEPLAERLGLEIHGLPEIGDNQTWRVPDGWDPKDNRGVNVAAYSSGRAMAGMGKLETLFPEGHVVCCSHGHVIPALMAHLAGLYGLTDVPSSFGRGQWYRMRSGNVVPSIELVTAAEFPTEP